MKNTILNSFIGAIVFCLTCFLILYAVKARTTTNPWYSDPNTSALYANTNDTLTAAKRNTLVSTTVKKKIYCSKANGTLTTTAAWSQTYTFVAADCGWELPDSNYIWVAGDMWVPWTYIYNFTTNFCGTKCVRFYHASWASGTFNISVTYFQK